MASSEVNIKVVLDESQAKRGISSLKSDLKSLEDTGGDALGKPADAAEDLGQAVEDAGSAAKDAGERLGKAGKEASEGAKSASERFSELSDKVGKVSDKAKSVGDTLTKTVTAPIVAAGAASLKAAVDIDTSLTNVRKTVDGTEEEYQVLKDAAVEFSKTNAVSASQILDIQALGAQLGFSIDELQEFGEVASGLDIATNMDAETAATEMAHFANIMGMGHDEIRNYASAIVGLGNNFATTESDISHMAQRIAGAGKSMGLSSADVLGLATALSSLGIEAEAGGTAISTIMSTVDMAAAQATEHTSKWAHEAGVSVSEFVAAMKGGGAGAEEMAARVGQSSDEVIGWMESEADHIAEWAQAAGMSGAEFAAMWSDKPVEAFQLVMEGLQGSVEEGSNLALMLDELGISSIRQTDTLKRLANSGDLMSEAVACANSDWGENVALSNEVANRNESLAAKFEMLKNRVTEVAMEVGEPLADALLDAVDAAEPLIQAVENGAKAFSEMDEEQQRAIISAVGLVAAVGPMLSLFGRAGGAASTLIGDVGKLAAKMEAAGGAGKLLEAGLTGIARFTPAALGVGALAGAIALQADYMAKEAEHAEKASGATAGLASAVQTARDAMGGALPATQAQADATRDLAESAGDALGAQAQLAQEMTEAWSDLGGQRSMLAEALATIDEYAGKVDGDAEKLAELESAVAVVNEVCGTNIEVTDAQAGKLSEATDKIRENADAWIENAEKQAAANQLVALKEQELQNLQAIGEAQADVVEKQREYDAAMAAAGDDIEKQSYAQIRYGDALTDSKERLAELSAAQDENAAAQDFLKSKISGGSDSLEAQKATITELIRKNSEWTMALAGMGATTDEAGEHLQAMGVSAEQAASLTTDQLKTLATMSQESFAILAESCEGDVGQAIATLSQLDGMTMRDKHVVVTDDGTCQVVKDETGEVLATLGQLPDATKVDVTDGGTADSTSGKIEHAKDTAQDFGGTYTASLGVDGADGAERRIKGVRETALAYARSYAATLNVAVNMSVRRSGSGGAHGGFYGSIPGHAAGGFSIPRVTSGTRFNGIVTKATLTDSGWLGERGREALLQSGSNSMSLVPIENRQYMAPFANAVADAMGERIGGDTITVGSIVVQQGTRLADDVGQLVDDLKFEMGLG